MAGEYEFFMSIWDFFSHPFYVVSLQVHQHAKNPVLQMCDPS